MGVSSLPKTVTRQRRDWDLNLGPSASESSTLTTRLPSHPNYIILMYKSETRFTKYLMTILRLSYDNAKVTID